MNTQRKFAFALFLLVAGAHAQPGTLDTSFDPGVSTTGFADYVHAIAVQDDDRIIIAGGFDTYQGEPRSGIARLHPDGTLDTSFNPGTGVTGVNGIVYDVHVDTDGRIMIVGSFWYYNGIPRNNVARLNADGSLDTTFDPGDGPNDLVWTVEGHDGDKYLIGGTFYNYLGTTADRLVRLNNDGSMDPTFNPGAVGPEGPVHCLATYGDGRILIGGQFDDYNGNIGYGLARLLPNGTYDPTFNVGIGADNVVLTLSIQGDEKIIVGGGFNNINGVSTGRAARLLPDGTVDTGFITGTGADGNVHASCVQSDGAILLGGEFNQFNGVLMYKFVRLDTNGALDPAFTLDPGPNNQVNATVLQEDGRILIGGIFTEYDDVPRRRVARINGTVLNGVPESGSVSVALRPNPASHQLWVHVTTTQPWVVMEVCDATGKQVLRYSMRSTGAVLDVQALAPGVYTIHVIGALPLRFVKE
ncbi:MAG: T9SS type A sorting domain-containing protein [Flavobacteriales bacterium]